MLNILIHNVPNKLPPAMQKIADQLKKAKNKKEALHKAYHELTKRFRGEKYFFIKKPGELFVHDLNNIWTKKKVLTCTTVNYLLKVLLIKSGWFDKKDVINKWTLIHWKSPHQYLKIKLGKKLINVDLWGYDNGIPFGKYAH